MGSSPVANPVCWGSIIAIPLNLTIPCDDVGDGGQRDDESDLDRRGHEGGGLATEALLDQPVAQEV